MSGAPQKKDDRLPVILLYLPNAIFAFLDIRELVNLNGNQLQSAGQLGADLLRKLTRESRSYNWHGFRLL